MMKFSRRQKYNPLSTGTHCGGDEKGDIEYQEEITSQSRSQVFTAVSILTSFLFLNIVCLWWIRTTMLKTESSCGSLATAALFGDIPWVPRTFLNNDDFVDSDPYDGNQWGVVSKDAEDRHTPWDLIYPGTYVALENPESVGFDGGLDMVEAASNISEFQNNSQGFGVAVMHQLHCVGLLKHTIVNYEQNGVYNLLDSNHLHHCVEMLRQAVLCHGDLSLERPIPDAKNRPVLVGWGSVHMCRDEKSLLDSLWRNSITRNGEKWVRRPRPDTLLK